MRRISAPFSLARVSLAHLALALFTSTSLFAATSKVEFSFRDRDELAALEATGAYEIVEVNGNRAVALETKDEAIAALPTLANKRTVTADIDEELAEYRRRGDTGLYHTVASAEAELKDVAAKYPDICKLESIGKTFEGRDMWALRITGAADTTKVPRMLFFGLTHAREWISMELPFYVIRKLTGGYGTDAAMKTLVDTHCIWIMPVTNPDGLNYSQTSYKMWRKNRSKRSGSQIGVDVNRNFEVGWGQGSSSSPGSDVYRGPNFNSEEETKALIALVERERFNVSLSVHSYSELILYPWGYSRQDPPRKEVFAAHGKAMQKFNNYKPGSVAQILYTAGGATDDTFFTKYGCWSWTFELGRQFVPADKDIKPIMEANFPAVLHLLNASAELAAMPPPTSPNAPVAERLAMLEGAYHEAQHSFLDGAPTGAVLAELVSSLAEQVDSDARLAAAVRARAQDPELAELYRLLVPAQ